MKLANLKINVTVFLLTVFTLTSVHGQSNLILPEEVEISVTVHSTNGNNEPIYSHSYHFVNAAHEGDNPKVYALVKDTNIYWQGAYYQLNEGDLFDLGTVSQGDFIESNKPLSIGSNKNGVDLPVPIEFAGSEFVIPLVRETHYIYAKNIDDAAIDVEFFDGATSSVSTIQINEIVRFDSNLNGFSAALRTVDQSARLLVSHSTDISGDSYPVAPAVLELFGVRTGSASIGALNDNTTVFQYADNGDVSEQIVNAGDRVAVIGNAGIQGSASFVRITSDQPIGIAQIGDADGGEQTVFIPQSVFARQYILPVDTQYVAMGCFGVNSSISIFAASGELLETTTCSSSSSLPGKAYLGSTINGTQFSAGSRIESSEPIYLIYEPSSTGDESNLMGSLLTQPHGYHFLNARFEGDTPAVYGIVDGTEVHWKGSTYQIDAGELLDIGVVAQGDFIESSHVLAIGSDKNGTDMPVPVEFAGTQFSIPLQRDTHYIYVKNSHNYNVDIDFFNGVFSSVVSIPANSISRLDTTANGLRAATLESVDKVSTLLVSHVTDIAGDAYSVAPLAREVFGIRSSAGYIGGIDDGAYLTQYADNGVVSTSILDAVSKTAVIGDASQQGEGSFVRVEANKPISGVQYADGDGGDQTAFIPETMFARNFVLPVDTQYVAMGCIDLNVQISVYAPNGVLQDLISCNSTAQAPGKAPGKAYFGGSEGVQFTAGSRIVATEPIYLIYEASATNDEHNLMGEKGQPLDVRPSSLIEPFSVSLSGVHTFNWGLPEFDSNLYDSFNVITLLQRLDENGTWVTQDPALYNVNVIAPFVASSTSFVATESESGFYQYRLLREFILISTQSAGPSLGIPVMYAEEPFHLLVLPTVELQGNLSWPSLLTVPEESEDGNYTIVTDVNRDQYTHTNGVTYPIFGFANADIYINTVSGGPLVDNQINFDSINNIENQPPGVYEYTSLVNAFFIFQEFYDFALSQGFVVPGDGSHELFETDLNINDDVPSRITVLEDVRASTLRTTRSKGPLLAIYKTTNTQLLWSLPEFDSSLYTLESNNTVLQRLGLDGNWVTQEDSLGLFAHRAVEPGPGLYQYRLRREFTLAPLDSGSLPSIEESYVEEPTNVFVLSSAVLSGVRLEGPSPITLQSESDDGNYSVQLVGYGLNEYVHTNGTVYPIDIRIFHLDVRTVEGGPGIELDDGGDDSAPFVTIQDQLPGVYEYSVNYEANIFFQEDFDLAVSEGLIDDDPLNYGLFVANIFVFGTTPSTIRVIAASEVDPIGPGSADVDTDGDGVNDAFDPYPLQNGTQCLP